MRTLGRLVGFQVYEYTFQSESILGVRNSEAAPHSVKYEALLNGGRAMNDMSEQFPKFPPRRSITGDSSILSCLTGVRILSLLVILSSIICTQAQAAMLPSHLRTSSLLEGYTFSTPTRHNIQISGKDCFVPTSLSAARNYLRNFPVADAKKLGMKACSREEYFFWKISDSSESQIDSLEKWVTLKGANIYFKRWITAGSYRMIFSMKGKYYVCDWVQNAGEIRLATFESQ